RNACDHELKNSATLGYGVATAHGRTGTHGHVQRRTAPTDRPRTGGGPPCPGSRRPGRRAHLLRRARQPPPPRHGERRNGRSTPGRVLSPDTVLYEVTYMSREHDAPTRTVTDAAGVSEL